MRRRAAGSHAQPLTISKSVMPGSNPVEPPCGARRRRNVLRNLMACRADGTARQSRWNHLPCSRPPLKFCQEVARKKGTRNFVIADSKLLKLESPSARPYGTAQGIELGRRSNIPPRRCAIESVARRSAVIIALTTRCTKGGCKLDDGRRMPGAGLKPLTIREGTAWKASLPAVLGKTRRTE
jgi:hypothetical protein